jgi:hypothetical protein
VTNKQTALTVAFVAGVSGFAFNAPTYAQGSGCLSVDCQEYSGIPGDKCSFDGSENACECGEENTCYCSTGQYPPCGGGC